LRSRSLSAKTPTYPHIYKGCKSVHSGSIPLPASNDFLNYINDKGRGELPRSLEILLQQLAAQSLIFSHFRLASFFSTQKQVTTKSQTNTTDFKPGWAAVLFGADDDVDTTTTTTFTTSNTTDDKTEDKITSTVTLFSEGADDPYNVKIFYDNLFGTYLALDANSPALQGGSVVGNRGFNA
jgi:hypothetical protein